MGQTQSLSQLSETNVPEERKRMERADNPATAIDQPWRRWGCYLSDRQWGTVREDYGRDGNSWAWFTHDDARSRAYRWGEDGILGWSDDSAMLNFSIAMWNGKDDIIKERLFGLNNDEGPHGEDVKEYYTFDDAVPSASYMKGTYRYPMERYPYEELLQRNLENRGKLYETGQHQYEVELHECGGALQNNRFWDVTVEYAKNDPEDVSIRITAENCSDTDETLVLLPSLFYRNTWSWKEGATKPTMWVENDLAPKTKAAAVCCDPTSSDRKEIPGMTLLIDDVEDDECLLFCDNNTVIEQFEGRSICRNLYKNPATNSNFGKNCINNTVVAERYFGGRCASDDNSCNPANAGTKMSSTHVLTVPAGEKRSLILRLLPTSKAGAVKKTAFDEKVFETRIADADAFYKWLNPKVDPKGDHFAIQRQAYAGMLWTRQVYIYDVSEWLREGPVERLAEGKRNRNWIHLYLHDVLSVCDGWEYPWHASWDLAFHLILFAHLDPSFAKQQALLLFKPCIVHPTGKIPSFEWDFSDFSPPVAAFGAWMIYDVERSLFRKEGDKKFLRRIFPMLYRLYVWFTNQSDHGMIGSSFLGLDNSQVINRSKMCEYPNFEAIYQADGTAWCASMALSLMKIALELDMSETAASLFCNTVYRGHALNNFEDGLPRPGFARPRLWDDKMGWFCDVVKYSNSDELQSLKCRTLIGMVPLFATQCFQSLHELGTKHPMFAEDVAEYTSSKHNHRLTERVISVSVDDLPVPMETERTIIIGGDGERKLGMFLVHPDRLRIMLTTILDPNHFLSDFGIRSASKDLEKNPYHFDCGEGHGWKLYNYQPRESYGDGKLFGGNSSWRGPIWLPTNYFLLCSLCEYYDMLGGDFKVDFPTGSGEQKNLKQVATEIAKRLVRIFEKREDGTRAMYGHEGSFYNRHPQFSEHVLFYEYFDGDTGEGVGSSHQTGWTGLVADLIARLANCDEFA